MLRDKFSAEDRKIYKKLWENTRLVNKNGKQRVEVEYLYRNKPHETFKKENSNIKEALTFEIQNPYLSYYSPFLITFIMMIMII